MRELSRAARDLEGAVDVEERAACVREYALASSGGWASCCTGKLLCTMRDQASPQRRREQAPRGEIWVFFCRLRRPSRLFVRRSSRAFAHVRGVPDCEASGYQEPGKGTPCSARSRLPGSSGSRSSSTFCG